MSEWADQLDEAARVLDAGDSNASFRLAFGALELCFANAANLATRGNCERFIDVLNVLLDCRKISRLEYDQARHLANARNVSAHGPGFEPSLAESKRCLDRIRRLCGRFGTVVSDVMAKPVVVVAAQQPVGACLEVMREKGFTYLPVVNEQGNVVGTIDEWALIEAIREEEGLIDLDKPAAEYMKHESLPTIAANASVDEAARKLKNTRCSALLVVAGGKPTGICTPFDLIR